jgi:phosphopantetheinyl transferase (holo-ACP synthase)
VKNKAVGVDLVYLPVHGKVNTIRNERLQRLYAPSELELFQKLHPCPTRAEAIAWSLKETAFKFFNAPRLFQPKRYVISKVKSREFALVKYDSEEVVVFFNWLNNNTLISHTDCEQLYIRSGNLNSSECTWKGLSHDYDLAYKSNGKPYLLNKGTLSTKSISISHQGGYIAFAL